ncbi:TIGR01777 family oxidoreductase [Melioribacteraceae bacterium 4301-Me]|uniref:TIGR01777 family oxidoreductase n=1 Tax=Pyranulibacter aquaticus TaxID=3163344 RepID=UPI003599440A
MRKKVILTGSTGLIGKKLFLKLKEKEYDVIIFSRNLDRAKRINFGAKDYVHWDVKSANDLKGKHDWEKQLEEVHAIIHLAGENIMAKRWTSGHKKKILESRIYGTRSLVDAVSNIQNKPKVFICASAVGYYGNSENEVDENSPSGNGFLVEVVKKWEEEAAKIEDLNVRRVSIRLGIVLDKNEGALPKLLLPFKLFMGGYLGSGKQWFPWIHIEDVVNIFLFALENNQIAGALNAVSPNPVRMKEFCKILGKVMNRPSYLNVPAFAIKAVLGEAANSILEGAKVIPLKAFSNGYKFSFDKLEDALRNILEN